jgi:hypothetical protein
MRQIHEKLEFASFFEARGRTPKPQLPQPGSLGPCVLVELQYDLDLPPETDSDE